MPRRSFLQARPFLVLGIVLLAWLILPTVFKSFVRISFFELQAPFIFTSSNIRDVQDFWALRTRSKYEVIEAARDLARLNAAYELRLQENEALRDEVQRLERILNLPSMPGHRYEIARVARRDIHAWWQQLIIRKGYNAGIQVGAPVVYSGGVVGRVSEVHAYTAVIELITSPNLRLAANVENDERPITFQGGINPPFQPPHGRIDFVPPDIRIEQEQPKRLVTSGLGGVFPPGLLIGRVVSLEPSTDGLFQSGRVALPADLRSLKEVAVLLPLHTDP